MSKLNKILVFILFAIAAAFSIKGLREPDIWWQIRTGEWIIEHGRVPDTDVFSFSKYGEPWINIKWGFEVLAALTAKYCGPESIFILQIFISICFIYLFIKISQLLEIKDFNIVFLTSICILLGIEYRMIGRPEMFSHFLALTYLYLFLKWYKTQSNWIWLILPLQVFWTNMHEAYGMGWVIVAIFISGFWIDSFIHKRYKPLKISILLPLTILVSVINPRHVLLLIRPFDIFKQVQDNKYTTELVNILDLEFWQKEAYLFLIILSAIFVFIYRQFKKDKLNFYKSQLPSGYFIGLVAFSILSFTAYRNIIFSMLWFFPILVLFFNKIEFKSRINSKTLIISGLVLYVLIVTNSYYSFVGSRDRFGLQVLPTHNPIGAAEFIERKGLKSQKGMSDYLTSSYLLWHLKPNFKTYIDLRDLDVFDNDFFDSYLNSMNFPDSFLSLDKIHNFRYVVLYRKSDPILHAYLYRDSIYACTYVDAVAAVYEKTDDFSRDDIFNGFYLKKPGLTSNLVNFIFNPFFKPGYYTDLDVNLYAAEYYFSVGKLELAQTRLNKYLLENPNDNSAIELRNNFIQVSRTIK
jgi:hypothetical protein